jgi:cytochrome c
MIVRPAMVSACLIATIVAGAWAQGHRPYGLGRPATEEEIASLNHDAAPDGEGLPPGRGSVAQGQLIYQQQCTSCHGPRGEGVPPAYPALTGRDPKGEGFPFGRDPKIPRPIGNYWPYATTLFDYIRRAMPLTASGALTNDQVYAVTAYLLAADQVIPMTAVLDSASLVSVKMPYRDRFVPDNRRGGNDVK